MTAQARFDLKLDKNDKELFSEAASLMGTSMASFVCRKRSTASVRQCGVLEEQRLDTKAQDCAAFDCGHLFYKTVIALSAVGQIAA